MVNLVNDFEIDLHLAKNWGKDPFSMEWENEYNPCFRIQLFTIEDSCSKGFFILLI